LNLRESTPAAPEQRVKRWGHGAALAIVLGAVLVGGVAVCEALGWPFLTHPAERWLSSALGRPVQLADASLQAPSAHLHLLGGIRLDVPHLVIGNAGWSRQGPMVDARQVRLRLRWRDLLWHGKGQPLRIEALNAQSLDLALQRRPDGSANWQFGPADTVPAAAAPRFDGVVFDRLGLAEGSASLLDGLLQSDAQARFSWHEGDGAGPGDKSAPQGITLVADGRYRGQPLHAELRSQAAVSKLALGPAASSASVAARATADHGARDPTAPSLPVRFKLRAGQARFDFEGTVRDPLGQRAVAGQFHLSGPSLAAVGAPMGLTLPTTHAFAMAGRVVQAGTHWSTLVDRATVGDSRLAGEFTFDAPAGQVPRLAGRLRGAALFLRDLGPVIGAAPDGPTTVAAPGRMLPDRPFDLPSMRAMNANVVVSLDKLDAGTPALQPVAPLYTHLVLKDGVFSLNDIDARLAQGRLTGRLVLDGTRPVARASADLKGRGLEIAQWIKALQRPGKPPYASGRLAAHLQLQGQGNSTAQLLGSSDGHIALLWTQGSVSHLAEEVAGLDIAQGLGMLARGDDALPIDCGAGDLTVSAGTVTPRVLLVDTRDSTLWLDGDLSLASEQLNLTAHVAPKDFSPLSLRSPLHIRGTLAQPDVSLDKTALLRRAVPAALLALVNPFAAVLPLLDAGEKEPGEIKACQAVAEHYRQSGVH
jgi:uncharacterized protein involved in outer membrane biogenesis